MYKKILSVILAGLMLVSFAGCSNKEADKSESNELVLFNAKGENAAEFEEMEYELALKEAIRDSAKAFLDAAKRNL